MSVEIHKLTNGATVLIDPMPHTQTAALGYYFRIGSRYETLKENGLAHFLEHMAFKGTPTRNVNELASEMDNLGAMANAFTSKEATCYYMAGAAEDVSQFNNIVADMAMNMTLPTDELERERGAILEEIKMYSDRADSVMDDNSDRVTYSKQAYGRPILGPPSNIQKFDREIFESFRKKHYHAGNLIVSVAGNVDPERILQDIEATAGQMEGGKRSKFRRAKFEGAEIQAVRPDKQINLMATFQASALGHDDNSAEAVMSTVLSGGMSSRLFREIREKRGLVYTVRAGIGRSTDIGELGIMAGTSPEKVAILMPVLCDELNKMKSELISEEELARAKKKLLVSTLSSDESTRGSMTSNAGKFNMRGRIQNPAEIKEQINAVTREDVLSVAQKIFSTKPSLSSVGPHSFPDYNDMLTRLDI